MTDTSKTGATGNPGSWWIPEAITDETGLGLADIQTVLAAAMGFDLRDSVRQAVDDEGKVYIYVDRDGGVPTLPQPAYDFATAIAELGQLASVGLSGRMKMDLENTKTSFEERKSADQLRAKSLRTAMESMKECQETQGKQRQMAIGRASCGLIGAVLLAVLSVVLAPVTGGASVMAAIAAIVGITMAATQLATAVYAANGVQVTNADGTKRAKDVTITGMVTAVTQELIDAGKEPMASWSDEKVAKWQSSWSTALNMMAVLTMMVSGFGGINQVRSLAQQAKAGVESAIAQLKSLNVPMEQGVRAAELLTNLSDASLTVVDGHLTQVQGDLTHEASLATALKEYLSSLSTLSGAQAKLFSDAFERVMKALDASLATTDTLLHFANRTAPPSATLG